MKPLLAAFLTLVLAGCAAGPNYKRPATQLPAEFSNAGYATNGQPSTNWWAAFNDPLLNRILTQAATNNYDIQRAEARLREARALWRESQFDYAPTVTSQNRYENSRLSSDAIAPGRRRQNELYR